MTTPTTDLSAMLAESKRITDAATEGPWDFQPWSKHTLPSGEYAESILLSNASPDGEITREMSDEDGEFCAFARTALPQRDAIIAAVLGKLDALNQSAEEARSSGYGQTDATWARMQGAAFAYEDAYRRIRRAMTEAAGEVQG